MNFTFNPLVEASVGEELVPEGLYSSVAKYLGYLLENTDMNLFRPIWLHFIALCLEFLGNFTVITFRISKFCGLSIMCTEEKRYCPNEHLMNQNWYHVNFTLSRTTIEYQLIKKLVSLYKPSVRE
jgi:hypothetical protein